MVPAHAAVIGRRASANSEPPALSRTVASLGAELLMPLLASQINGAATHKQACSAECLLLDLLSLKARLCTTLTALPPESTTPMESTLDLLKAQLLSRLAKAMPPLLEANHPLTALLNPQANMADLAITAVLITHPRPRPSASPPLSADIGLRAIAAWEKVALSLTLDLKAVHPQSAARARTSAALTAVTGCVDSACSV